MAKMLTNCRVSPDFDKMFPAVSLGYVKGTDIQETEQVGGLDLCAALANRAVPGQVADNLLPPNTLADPELLLPRPADVFERIRQVKYVSGLLKDAEDSTLKHMAEHSASAPVDSDVSVTE